MCRLGTRTVGFEAIPGEVPQEALRHLRTGGVMSAQEQHPDPSPSISAAAISCLLYPAHGGSHQQVSHGLVEQHVGGPPVERVEAPLTALLLLDQPRVLELAYMVGDL